MTKIITLDTLNGLEIPSPKELKRAYPVTAKQHTFIHKTRETISNILEGKDQRLLLIVGPCSIHDLDAAKEYATKLEKLKRKVGSQFFIIMRTYFEKPRTMFGWKGMLYDPHLDGSNNILEGLKLSRQLLIDLAEMEIPAATEFLDPVVPHFIGDLISWACIGARTTESQIHRQFASGLEMPIAFKNNTSGNIHAAVNGVLSASHPHTFLGINEDGRLTTHHTKGNKDTHIVLRGGDGKPNYDPMSILHALSQLKKHELPARLIVDCSHDNSNRKYEEQVVVFKSVIEQYIAGNHGIRGMILESNLFAGNQALQADKSILKYAVSLTDPCLDWEATEQLILTAKDQMVPRKKEGPLSHVGSEGKTASLCQLG